MLSIIFKHFEEPHFRCLNGGKVSIFKFLEIKDKRSKGGNKMRMRI